MFNIFVFAKPAKIEKCMLKKKIPSSLDTKIIRHINALKPVLKFVTLLCSFAHFILVCQVV